MKALIFAAGRGERLKPLTDHTPKPLLKVQGKSLLQYHIEALQKAGITDLVINVSWLKEAIIEFVTELLQRPQFATVKVQFSAEENQPLETGGGMLKALPLLGVEPFMVVNADVYTDFDFRQLTPLDADQLVKLVLVENPTHNSAGDFAFDNHKLVFKQNHSAHYTYAGIGLYHPKLLSAPIGQDTFPAAFRIVPYIKAAIATHQAGAQIHAGLWHDVGTPERLDALNQQW